MSQHEGVSCDACLKSDFRGKRYKCLTCPNYDLCSNCFESGVRSTRHTPDHPMQCILTRSDYDIYYGGETFNTEQSYSLTCPFCGRMGLTEVTLHEHVVGEHSDAPQDVICPICASLPDCEPTHVTDDFATHIALEHRNLREWDEPQTAGRGRRAPHPTRGVSSSRPRRSQMQFNSNSGLSTFSSNNRDSMDPIAELLSQLSGVRRAANLGQAHANQVHQLQMQLQLERNSGLRDTVNIPSGSSLLSGGPSGLNISTSLAVGNSLHRPGYRSLTRRHPLTQANTVTGLPPSSSNSQTSLTNTSAHLQPQLPYLVVWQPSTTSAGVQIIGNAAANQALYYVSSASMNNGQSITSSVTAPTSSSTATTTTSSTSTLMSQMVANTQASRLISSIELEGPEIGQADHLDRSFFAQELLLNTMVQGRAFPDPRLRKESNSSNSDGGKIELTEEPVLIKKLRALLSFTIPETEKANLNVC